MYVKFWFIQFKKGYFDVSNCERIGFPLKLEKAELHALLDERKNNLENNVE